MTTLTGWLTIINLAILIAGAVGGALIFRSSMANAERAVQERVRQALHDENELLQARVKRLESENRRLNGLMLLVITTLKRTHGIELEIDEDIVTLRSPGGAVQVSRLQSLDSAGA